MIKKIDQYLTEAIKKPCFICAMVFDPKFKTSFWEEKHISFIDEHHHIYFNEVVNIFETALLTQLNQT